MLYSPASAYVCVIVTNEFLVIILCSPSPQYTLHLKIVVDDDDLDTTFIVTT